MRRNSTTFERALGQARKLQPTVRQVGSSLLFDVASTSHLDQFYHVELSYNKINPLKEAKCECDGPKSSPCVHRLAALLQYVSNLESKLWKGSNFIAELEDEQQKGSELYEKHLTIWLEMLRKYELACDLIKAIERGENIYNYNGKHKPENQPLPISA